MRKETDKRQEECLGRWKRDREEYMEEGYIVENMEEGYRKKTEEG